MIFFDFLGWQTGYRSLSYYQSGATYITITLGNSTIISKIKLTRLTGSTFVAFSSFQVSFSDDGSAYAFLPEVM